MIPREPWLPLAVGARCFFSPLIHLSLSCLRKLSSVSPRGVSLRQAIEGKVSILACQVRPTAVTGGFLVLVVAQGQQPPSIRAGRLAGRPMPYASWDALGKPEREADPSLLRRAKRLPGTITVRSSSPDLGIPWRARRTSFLHRLMFSGRGSRLRTVCLVCLHHRCT